MGGGEVLFVGLGAAIALGRGGCTAGSLPVSCGGAATPGHVEGRRPLPAHCPPPWPPSRRRHRHAERKHAASPSLHPPPLHSPAHFPGVQAGEACALARARRQAGLPGARANSSAPPTSTPRLETRWNAHARRSASPACTSGGCAGRGCGPGRGGKAAFCAAGASGQGRASHCNEPPAHPARNHRDAATLP